jgi:hypothetical protein
MRKIIRSKETSQMQWLQGPSGINGDNLNNIRLEASRQFGNKNRQYMKELMSLQRTVRGATN